LLHSSTDRAEPGEQLGENNMKHTRIPQTDAALKAMNARNQARAAIVIRSMGTRYACHPVNQVHHKDHVRHIVSIKLSGHALDRIMRDITAVRG
jgi:hypothetical protein